MSSSNEDAFLVQGGKPVCVRAEARDYLKMKQSNSKRYTNFVLCAAIGAIVAVISLVLFLAVIEYRSEMEILRRSINTLREDILVQMANDKKHFHLKHAHDVHRRESGDVIVERTISLVDTNFTRFDDTVKKSLVALDNITSEIIGIRDELKETKKNFSNDISRIEKLAKKRPSCSQTPLAIAQANEIIRLIAHLNDAVTSLKRVMVLSTLKSATVRSNQALLSRFECTLKEAMAKVENRIEALEGVSQNITDHTTGLGDSLDVIRIDIQQMQDNFEVNQLNVVTSLTEKLSVTQSKCTNKDFLQTMFDDLKAGVNNMADSSKVIQDKLQDIFGKTKALSSSINNTNARLESLKTSQSNVGKTCAENGEQAIAILHKLDMFNETEPETDYSFTEYCAQRHGCIRVKSPKKHCYKIYDTISDSWFGASETCAEEGGYLVEINSDTEYQKLTNFITRTRYYWIGGTDLNSEGSWYWGNSKERVWLNAWRGNNPSNDGGVEHCMHLYANRISWNDANCLVRQSFICEKDGDCDGWE